jgi:cardiolipin synthase
MFWLDKVSASVGNWIWVPLVIIYLGVILTILLENRNVNKSFSYIFLLVFFPVIGLVVFYYFGRDYRKRYKLRLRETLKHSSILYLEERLRDTHKKVLQHLKQQYPGASKTAFMLAKTDNSLALAGNDVRLLINGEEKFPAIFEAIENARHHIHIEYYILSFDDVGRRLLDLLVRKSQSGVEIRVIVDGVGSDKLKKLPQEFQKYNIRFEVFMPVAFTNLASPNYRNHRKILVVDGKVGFIGGLNMDDRYWNNGKHQLFWRDTHLRIEGPAVNMLQLNFKLTWDYLAKERLPTIEPYFNYAHVESTAAPITISSSGPISPRPSGMDSMVSLIYNARESIRISNPYFIPSDELKSALITAALSGRQVQLLLPGISDSKLVQYASNSYLKPLLEHGVQVFFYQKGFLHAKTMTIDDEVCMVGTLNTDIRSFYINFEITALVYDKKVTTQLNQVFEDDLEFSEQIDYQEWKKKPMTTRLLESTCRLFTPIL